MISRVLVANRGEIARRIFRTCRDMGISTVAVFSDADTDEPHVSEADIAIGLAGETAIDTYLDLEKILAAAKESGADAVHPGYGFLAESAEFARAVVDSGLVWIGPSPEAIEVMGSKLASKDLVRSIGVPTLESVDLDEDSDAGERAAILGFPVLVKASAGGGGKGMRVVSDPADLTTEVDSARREAEAAFGDGTVFLERYLSAPRHIEVQVFGDSHGRVISLHERECSIQRRHQKIVEESPSPALDDATRRALSEAALSIADAVSYTGAGTVEFLFQDGEFFFLEMNTRLQVEHPVTEMVTGLDLVRLQIEVADGESVPESAPPMTGHAVEARLYAENPLNDHLPVTGTFHRFDFPDLEGLRVDAGIAAGSVVSVHYDPMLAKVIAHGPTRQAAITTLATGLRQARVHGSTTNRALLVRILEHPEFVAGKTDTGFLDRNDIASLGRPLLDEAGELLSALAAALADQAAERNTAKVLSTIPSGWRNTPYQFQQRVYQGSHATHQIHYSATSPFVLDGVGTVSPIEVGSGRVVMDVGGDTQEFEVARHQEVRYVDSTLGPAQLVEVPRFPDADGGDDAGSLHAPMPGKVIRVAVSEGDPVEEGDILVVMEAMKMEHTIRAPHPGTVSDVLCSPGDQVEAAAVLVVVVDAT